MHDITALVDAVNAWTATLAEFAARGAQLPAVFLGPDAHLNAQRAAASAALDLIDTWPACAEDESDGSQILTAPNGQRVRYCVTVDANGHSYETLGLLP